jgi:asparagine synthase (glutamine-hydrolysing)
VRRVLCGIVGVDAAGTRRILGSEEILGHHSAFHDVYALMTAARHVFFHPDMLAALDDHNPYLELAPDLERMRRWHSINRSAYWAARIHLPGHLLSLKGDRPAMHSSVETRYPFLDEDVFEAIASMHPRWKMRGLRDKYILRLVAERHLPRRIAWRRKVMFRAPLDSFFAGTNVSTVDFVDQLLSEDALSRTGWFDPRKVQLWRSRMRQGSVGRQQRTVVQLGMVGVIASQLWYHTFIDGLADLPRWQMAAPAA